jgi:tRNA pseudouridine55 synthase
MRQEKILLIDKPVGLTPAQIVEKLKKNFLQFKNETISYAGRLDPMAHGLLMLLIGDENKKREEYLHLDKIYQVEMLFGFSTDTYDLLGKVSGGSTMEITQEKISRTLPRFVGKRKQLYPPYSSQPVNGKPLFYWARENKLSEITIPSKEITIHSLQFISLRTIRGNNLLKEILKRIALVKGDFRQKEIIGIWEKTINKTIEYTLVSATIFCSSGTYVRSLTHDIGRYIGSGAVAFDIYRTQIGEFSIKDSKILT